MSVIAFAGNLAQDPELQYTSGGQAVARFKVIEDRPRRTDTGWVDGIPNTHRVQVWGSQAEHLAESCGRGDRVTVIGVIATDRWTDETSGEPRTSQYVKAHEVGVSIRYSPARSTKATRVAAAAAAHEEAGGDEWSTPQ